MYMTQRGHLKAPANWINDPNGFIYFKGQYHLFYQHFPYEPRWGTMHWGHAVSRDLVNWEHKGIVLFPSKYGDQNGCFSGSALEHEGRLYLYYTGVHYHRPDPEDIHSCLDDAFESCQMMIASEDGMRFDNRNGKHVVIPPVLEKQIGDVTHTRDPKVWRGRDAWYMVLGSRDMAGVGSLLFYKSKNLTDWSYLNRIAGPKGFGWMWECPDYFETEGGNVLLISPMGFLKGRGTEENHAICMLADFDEKSGAMKLADSWQFFDYGLDLYAPQSTLDQDGRRVVIAWLRMPKPVEGGWRGMFCLPRVVEVKNGHIYFRVHPDVKRLYSKEITSVAEAREGCYRICIELADQETLEIGGFRIRRDGDRIRTDRSKVFPGQKQFDVRFETPAVCEGNRLDIYVDPNLIEIYINDGEYVVSNAVYGLRQELCSGTTGRLKLYTFEDRKTEEFEEE